MSVLGRPPVSIFTGRTFSIFHPRNTRMIQRTIYSGKKMFNAPTPVHTTPLNQRPSSYSLTVTKSSLLFFCRHSSLLSVQTGFSLP